VGSTGPLLLSAAVTINRRGEESFMWSLSSHGILSRVKGEKPRRDREKLKWKSRESNPTGCTKGSRPEDGRRGMAKTGILKGAHPKIMKGRLGNFAGKVKRCQRNVGRITELRKKMELRKKGGVMKRVWKVTQRARGENASAVAWSVLLLQRKRRK